jgi:CRP/FNR family transcriptional regulator, anaerobic regulatory protein
VGIACERCPVLASVLFSGLSSAQRSALGCVFRPAIYRKHQVLFVEGGSAQHIFALRSGLIKVVKSLENGRERITRVVYPGELIGVEALSEATYPLTAVTLRDCEICSASRDEFIAFLSRDSGLGLGMIRSLVEEVSQLRAQMAEMSFKDARMKTATFILSLIRSETAAPSSLYTLHLPFSRQEISEILELSPESVSRAFTSLQDEGLLEVRGRHLIVRNMEQLQGAARRHA